jgi:hypothetical protein
MHLPQTRHNILMQGDKPLNAKPRDLKLRSPSETIVADRQNVRACVEYRQGMSA